MLCTPLVGDGHDDRAERGTDHRAVAAGHQAATDDGGDDVLELQADALVGLDRAVAQGDQRAGEAAAQRHGDEQADLDLAGGHTDRPGGVLVAADGEDPVAPLGLGRARTQPMAATITHHTTVSRSTF